MPVCIVGMHRAGTSMVTRLLGIGGLYLGPDAELMPPSAENPDGYFEHLGFVQLNEEILHEFGGGWDFPPGLPDDWSAHPDSSRLRAKARALCDQLAGREPWGWKDPRTSLTLPFWLTTIPDLAVVICVRNPLEVAVSLHRRNDLSYEMSLDLWYAYYSRIVRSLIGQRYLVTSYDDYFSNPRAEIERIFTFVGLSAEPEALRRAETVVAGNLRHTRFTLGHLVDAEVVPDVIDLYVDLLAEARNSLLRPSGQVRTPKALPRAAGAIGSLDLRPPRARTGRLRRSVVDVELLRHEIKHLQHVSAGHEAVVRQLRRELEERDCLLAGRDITIEHLRKALEELHRAASR